MTMRLACVLLGTLVMSAGCCPREVFPLDPKKSRDKQDAARHDDSAARSGDLDHTRAIVLAVHHPIDGVKPIDTRVGPCDSSAAVSQALEEQWNNADRSAYPRSRG
jgi:hypothetical protein